MRQLFLIILVCALAAACDSASDAEDPTPASSPASGNESPAAGASPAALPSPVTIAEQPEAGFSLGDPALEALPGATVDAGRLGGMNYQIEMPDDWNGRLVLYAHGNDQDIELQVYPPPNRHYLIEHGYAWASSSYSVNVSVVTGVAADETAAVWDHFAETYGRPEYSYVMGDSMGGSVAFQSAERYADRYDGSLPLCGDAEAFVVQGDFFTSAAYAAGVTAAEWEASGENVGEIIDTRLRPMLRDPEQRAKFIALWADLSGGDRPFVDDGVAMYQEQIWVYVLGNLFQGVYNNVERTYELGDATGVSSDEYNRAVLRIAGKPGADKYADVNTITGDIQIPTLTVQMTGDALTIFNQTQELRRRAEEKGRGELLVQRAIQSPLHCFDSGITLTELEESFEDLVAWVESGVKPEGEDLSADVRDAGADFTRLPRVGSPDAASIPGAEQRLTVTGVITMDGAPVDGGFLWIDAVTDGRRRACSYMNAMFDQGRYRTIVAAEAEVAECGAPGGMLQIVYFDDGQRYEAAPVAWPANSTELTADLALTAANVVENSSVGTVFNGALTGSDGEPMAVGTRVEAYIGETLCGLFTVPPVKLVFDDGQTYGITVMSPDAIAGCTEGATVNFKIDGEDAAATGTHDLGDHRLELQAP